MYFSASSFSHASSHVALLVRASSYRLSTPVVILKTTFFRVYLFGGERGVFLICGLRETRKRGRKTVALERTSQKFSDIAVIAPVTVLK